MTNLEVFIENFIEAQKNNKLINLLENINQLKEKNIYFDFICLEKVSHILQNKANRYFQYERDLTGYKHFTVDLTKMMFNFSEKQLSTERYFNFVRNVDKLITILADEETLNKVKPLSVFLHTLKNFLLTEETFKEMGKILLLLLIPKYQDEKLTELTCYVSDVIDEYRKIANAPNFEVPADQAHSFKSLSCS